jgi:hypothetical protein
MKNKIAIKYVTSDNREIVLSESNLNFEGTPELSAFERKSLLIQVVTLLAIIATLSVYCYLGYLQYQANGIYRQQADIAKDAEITSLRAYMHIQVNDLKVSDTGNSDKPTEVDFSLVNEGETPAHNVQVTSQLVLVAYPITLTPTFRYNGTTPAMYEPAHISPPHHMQNYMTGVFSDEQIAGFQEDKYRLFLVGEIRYYDVFNIERRYRFGISFSMKDIENAIKSKKFEGQSNCSYEAGFNYEP